MFEEKIVGGIVRGLIMGILDAFTDEELEQMILHEKSQTNEYALHITNLIDPSVEKQLRYYIEQYRDRVPEFLNLRRIYQEAQQHRPSLCPIIERHQDWFKAWVRSLRNFTNRDFTGGVAPQ